MRMILLTMGTLISLAASTVTAVSQSKPETLRFPGDQEWWYTNETRDGSLMLSTQNNIGDPVPFHLICRLGYTDGRRHVHYYTQFQPPALPVKDSSGALVYRYKVSKIWDLPDRADEISTSVHNNHADRVEISRLSVEWLLFHETCHSVATRNCGREFVIEYYRPPNAGAEAQAKDSKDGNTEGQAKATYIRTRDGNVMEKFECSDEPRGRPCVDCTFLDQEACYQEANKKLNLGKRRHNGHLEAVGGPRDLSGYRNARDEVRACLNEGTTHLTSRGAAGGTIICPVPGAVVVNGPQQSQWGKIVYSAPPLSAANLFFDRCANLGIPSRKPPPPPPG